MGTLTDLWLTESNYYPDVTQKNRIIIGNINADDISFFNGWKLRNNGKYKKVSHYTIDQTGKVYNHFPVENYSDFVGIKDIDVESITIGLVNLGWIKHDVNKIRWVDWKGMDINVDPDKLIRKEWRGHSYWFPYSKKQIKSLVKLLKELSKKHKIEPLINNNNTLLINKKEFWPISFKGNYRYYDTSVTPAFPFEEVSNGINN
jgi:N-acetyl-anhydromuramyl-L-alanine amidase AmpD